MGTFTYNLFQTLRVYFNTVKIIRGAFMSCKVESGLAQIELSQMSERGPFELFTEWMDEFREYTGARSISFNLAAASLSGEVSNCTIVLRELQNDGFLVATKKNSKKAQHIGENPNVAACFCWQYSKNEKRITRQVRIQGIVKELSKQDCERLFQSEPTFCKIRNIICEQGEEVDWEDLKLKHDELLKKYKQGMELKMPETQVTYKIIPRVFDFYYAWDNNIAERIVFSKKNSEWTHKRVAA